MSTAALTHCTQPAWPCQHWRLLHMEQSCFPSNFSFSPTWVSAWKHPQTPGQVGTQTPGRRGPEKPGHWLYLEVLSWASVTNMTPRESPGGKLRDRCHYESPCSLRSLRPASVHVCGVACCVWGTHAVLQVVRVLSSGERRSRTPKTEWDFLKH